MGSSRSWRATRWRVARVALAVVLSAATGSGAVREVADKRAADAVPTRARIAIDIGVEDALAVRVAFRLALQRLFEIPACGALFVDLDLDGIAALSSTFYSSPRPGPERALCDRGALAVARAGGSDIRVCPGLRRFTREGVAAILIHEALHTAGLGEWPVNPEAPTSREITLAVLEACALG